MNAPAQLAQARAELDRLKAKEEQHEAEFQRRAAELLKEVIDENVGAAATYAVRAVAERRNIQLP